MGLYVCGHSFIWETQLRLLPENELRLSDGIFDSNFFAPCKKDLEV